ncbi:MAG TPA: DNA primase [Candidatus Paceibacterota bacterium]|jgi:DNA primase, catalytic core
MSTHVQDIKERLNIVDVVGSYVKLDKSGANWKARCPFHNEKTPSFYVSPDRGSFYCFGCGVKGDIFTFVEKFEGTDFMGALKTLAARAGIELRPQDRGADNRKERLYQILEDATSWFEENLAKDDAAKAYILGRGLSEKTITDFRVGFAPADWRQLRNFLKGKGYSDADVEAVGLIKKTDKPGADPYYDVFRGRIVFPISDPSGRVVAFSGRIIVDDGKSPKYLNSPETALYRKSKSLYGIDRAKMDIRKRDYSILVEGQMDLVMSHQAGFTNTVAASGTAFTEDDGADSAFGLLTRLSENIVLAFDSDAAGQKAVRRIVPAISLGMNVKIVDIKGGKDPADIIKEDPKAWAKMLEVKKDFVDFLVDVLVDSKANATLIGKQVRTDIFPYVRAIQGDTARANAIRRIADRLGLREDALWKDLQDYVRTNPVSGAVGTSPGGANNAPVRSVPKTGGRLESIERKILGILYSPRYHKSDQTKEGELEKIVGAERMKQFKALSLEDLSALTLEAEVTYGEMDIGKEWTLLLYHLEEEYAKERLEELVIEVNRAEKSKADTAELMKEIQTISKRIQELKRLTTEA